MTNFPQIQESGAPTPAPARDDPAQAPWGVREIITALFFTLLAFAAVSLITTVLIVLLDLPRDDPQRRPAGALIGLVAQGILDAAAVAIAALLSIRKYRLTRRAWGLRPNRLLRPGLAGATLAGCYVALFAYIGIVQALHVDRLKPEANVPDTLFEHAAVVPFVLVFVVFVAPLAEEIFFRGFIFNGLRRRLTTPGAALTSGAAFAAIHVTGAGLIGLIIPFTIIGFLLAMLVARTGSLWNSILVHATFNTISVAGTLGGLFGAMVIGALVGGALLWWLQWLRWPLTRAFLSLLRRGGVV